MQKFLANSKCLNKEALWVSVIAYRKKKRKDEIVNPKADVSQKLKLWSYLLRRYKESANFMAFQTKCRTSVLRNLYAGEGMNKFWKNHENDLPLFISSN